MNDKFIRLIYVFLDTCFSIIRIALNTSFKKTIPFLSKSNICLIMGNGPSLIKAMGDNIQKISELDLVAVNYMALSPEYIKYKPNIYVLCDPAYWYDTPSEDVKIRVRNLYAHISEKTHWKLQLYIPYQARKNAEISITLSNNPNIRLCYYNKTKFEGYKFLCYRIYNKQWGMSRAQNVIVASLMLSIYSGYKEIYLAGADSDYIKNFWVDEDNNLRHDDRHFYKDAEKNVKRVLPEKIHEEMLSNYYMFKSYIDIEAYSVYRKIKIYNTGLSSFIDAFEKKSII